jgi:putative addiction module component (TIGR02574 family)
VARAQTDGAILECMKDADSIIKRALELPSAERGRIAARLIESLDEEGPPNQCTEDELAEKINRRVAEIKAGTAKLVDGKRVIKEARARLRKRRR